MIELLAQTTDFVVVNKPPHSLIAAGRHIAELPLNRELEKQLGTRVWTVHRLDRETSGVLVFALNAQTHRTLSLAFEKRQVFKQYQALCWGHLLETSGLIDLPLRQGRKNLMRICSTNEEGLSAQTQFSCLKTFSYFSQIQLEPKTGRTHQLRVHLAAKGHPILGDIAYYPTARVLAGFTEKKDCEDAKRVMLHASQLKFTFNEQEFLYECPLPLDFQVWLEKYGLNNAPE